MTPKPSVKVLEPVLALIPDGYCELILKRLEEALRSSQVVREAEQAAEAAGLDAGLNGPTIVNAHFKFFTKPELTAAWERGKKRGDEQRSGGDKQP